MHKQIKKAFTLVELIVVITILAILGTIAFISLSGYSADARDSSRISDISSIKSSLELYQLDAGKYPNPTDGVNILYSGSVVWNQGTFGETVFTNTDKLNKIPTDPLSDKEYTYSVINTKNEYEIGGMIEGDEMALNPSQPSLKLGKEQNKANAGTTEVTAYTSGNYNGQMSKTLSGNLCTVLSLPGIITNDTSVTDLQQIVTQKKLVYRGFNNLPSSFKTSKFKYDGGFDFTPNKLASYSDTGSCTSLIDKTDYSKRVQLLKGLQDSYSGTIMNNVGEIKNILSLVIDENNPSQEVVKYAGNFVNNNLGGELIMDKDVVLTGPTVKLISSLNPNGTIAINNKLTLNNYTLSQTDIAYLTKSIMARNTCNASGSVISYLTGQGYTYSNGNIQLITPPSSVTGFCNFNSQTNTISQCITAGGAWNARTASWAGYAAWPSGSYYDIVNASGGNVGYWRPTGGVYLGTSPQGSTQNLTTTQIYTAISGWLSTANLDYFLTDCNTTNPYTFVSTYNSDGTIYVSHPNYGTGVIDTDNIGIITKSIYGSGTCNGTNSVISYLTTNNYTSSGGQITNQSSSAIGDCNINPDNVTLSQCISQVRVYMYSGGGGAVVARQEVGTPYVLAHPWEYNLGPAVNQSFGWWIAYSNPGINPEGGTLTNLEIHTAINTWLKTANLNYFLNNCSSGNIYTSISSLLH